MGIIRRQIDFEKVGADVLVAWQAVPAATAADCMNRSQTMNAAIKPLSPGIRLCGQARTVETMVGDNSAIHAAMRHVEAGEILVIDGRGHRDTALWGSLLTHEAMEFGLAGVVIDGAARDAAEIRKLEFPCFCSANVPRGPNKGFGGTIDGLISCGGVAVQPGDLVLGDDDGVVVVPLDRQTKILEAALALLRREQQLLETLRNGETLADNLGIPDAEFEE